MKWPRVKRPKRERSKHDDRDPKCKYFWGDRSPLDMSARCRQCNPRGREE